MQSRASQIRTSTHGHDGAVPSGILWARRFWHMPPLSRQPCTASDAARLTPDKILREHARGNASRPKLADCTTKHILYIGSAHAYDVEHPGARQAALSKASVRRWYAARPRLSSVKSLCCPATGTDIPWDRSYAGPPHRACILAGVIDIWHKAKHACRPCSGRRCTAEKCALDGPPPKGSGGGPQACP